jgi:hypothetical protein
MADESDINMEETEGETGTTEGGKRSKWMTHVKSVMRANKGKSLSQVLKMAAKTYKKGAKTVKKTKGKSKKGPFGLFGGKKGSKTRRNSRK